MSELKLEEKIVELQAENVKLKDTLIEVKRIAEFPPIDKAILKKVNAALSPKDKESE